MANPQAMLQAFQGLMQDPVAMQAMMQGAQQMGIPPQMLQQLMGGAGGGQMPAPPMAGGGQPMPPEAEVDAEGGMPPADMPPGEMSPEDMVEGEIEGAGYTWDGVDAPTQNDIDRLMSDPSPEAIASFDEQFGEGAAQEYLGEGGSEPSEEPEGGGPEPVEAEDY